MAARATDSTGESARRVAGVAQGSQEGGSDAPVRSEPKFRGKGQLIETWPTVITEQWWEESSHNMDFAVGQSFGEPQG